MVQLYLSKFNSSVLQANTFCLEICLSYLCLSAGRIYRKLFAKRKINNADLVKI